MLKTAILKTNELRMFPSLQTTEDDFYVIPIPNLDSAEASAGCTDDACSAIAIMDDEGTFYLKGVELHYDTPQSVDIAVMITVPEGWMVGQTTGGTAWTPIDGTNSYVTAIPHSEINKVVNQEKDHYDDPFKFTSDSGYSIDPAIRITRPS